MGPLVGELAFLVALALAVRFHTVGESLLPGLPGYVVTSLMVLVISLFIVVVTAPLVRVLRRLPFVAPIDRVAGLVVHTVLAFVVLYLFIGAVIDFDRSVRPVLQTGVVTARQVREYRAALEANPAARQYVNRDQLRLAEQTADRQPLPIAAFEKLSEFLAFYRRYIREPLIHSSLAPIINSTGSSLPYVGHPRPYLQPVKEPN